MGCLINRIAQACPPLIPQIKAALQKLPAQLLFDGCHALIPLHKKSGRAEASSLPYKAQRTTNSTGNTTKTKQHCMGGAGK